LQINTVAGLACSAPLARNSRLTQSAWHAQEPVLHIGGGSNDEERTNANGVPSFSPGLARRRSAYPGIARKTNTYPNGVASIRVPGGCNPCRVDVLFGTTTQGSSFLATLG